MITSILAKILGTNNARQLRKLQPIVDKINAFEPSIKALSDEQLKAKTNEFRERLMQGQTLDDILPEAFAVVREAAHRVLGERHYDVQLIGGIVLHQGKIAEMKTGEGKTLTATLPLYLNALSGKGAHLVTTNDYLANRDASWMGRVFTFLGLTCAALRHDMTDEERKEAYQSDIMYATNNELGFDYLRDNMKHRLSDYVQRDLNFAIVDEVDSILIDEARTPLIISGGGDASSDLYEKADKVVRKLVNKDDYEVDEKARSVQLTEGGNDKVESLLGIDNLYAVQHLNLLHHITQALRANTLFKIDVDYVVRDGEVLIVDEFTGRILSGRRYSDGLHQALEAKEGVNVARESQTLASITLQNFFRLYKKLAGMTGTAVTESEEFHKIYKLDVIAVPTNENLARLDKSDLIFLTRNTKYKAIVDDIKARYAKRQPVLIGTIAIETSELLSHILRAAGIPHEVLNAKQHEREAEIVEHAGEPGRITIATNMAGRGTDIKLTPESKAAGGLYVLGTERHESRRIDNQLRGRSGRQGDEGESRFYISLEDDLIRIFGGDNMKKNMERFGMTEDETIESPFISKTIERSQEKVEKHNFEIRKHLLEYDDVLNQQRMVVYGYRRSVLEGDENMYALVRDMLIGAVQGMVAVYCPNRTVTQDQADKVIGMAQAITGLPLEEIKKEVGVQATSDALETALINFLLMKYDLHRGAQPQDMIANAEKWLMLETIDQAWKQHMLNLDHLKEGINLRSWGQKNPLIEYKREAFFMFQDMMRQIRWDVVHRLFHIDLSRFDAKAIEQRREQELEELKMVAHEAPSAPTPAVRQDDKVGRNDQCSCGSGKKYKKCHGA